MARLVTYVGLVTWSSKGSGRAASSAVEFQRRCQALIARAQAPVAAATPPTMTPRLANDFRFMFVSPSERILFRGLGPAEDQRESFAASAPAWVTIRPRVSDDKEGRMTHAPARRRRNPAPVSLLLAAAIAAAGVSLAATNKPPLHARRWLAITGKPLG